MGWQVIDVIDFRIDLDDPLRLHQISDGQPDDQSHRCSDDTDRGTLRQKHPTDRRPSQAHRTQYANLSGLVAHHHRQGTHDAEGGYHRDQYDDQAHAELFQLERSKEGLILFLPALESEVDYRVEA